MERGLAQNKSQTKYVLAVVKKQMKNGQTDSVRAIYDVGDRVQIVKRNGTVLMGKITEISDSTVSLGGRTAEISGIHSICYTKGILVSEIIGSIFLACAATVVGILIADKNSGGDLLGGPASGAVTGAAIIGVLSLFPTGVGLIKIACQRHWVFRKKFKLKASAY